MKQWKKMLSIFMSGTLLITGGVLPQKNAANAEGVTDYGISNPRVEDGVTTWDKIKFGSYYQDAEVQPAEPIKWRVLSVDENNNAFLLADEILDAKPYNEEAEDVTWETCTLRKWLNESFYNEAFDDEEKKAIRETTVVNENNPNYDTEGGNDTKDKVYLLSIAEAGNAAYGFDTEFDEDSKTREAKSTDYAKLNNTLWSSSNSLWSSMNNFESWWLRSPGVDSDYAADVCSGGSGYGINVDKGDNGVRPALHINLSSSKVEDAGEVNSQGNVTMLDNGISTPVVKDGVTTWDCVYFGNYRQDFSVKQDIEWRVLSVDGDDAFLLADRNLDGKRYNEKSETVTWETCTLRKWLNEDFYNEAFEDEEKKAVMETTVVNEDNPSYGTDGGNDTRDKVYLLSIAEACNASYGFDTEFNEYSKTREVKNTDYAKVNNIWSGSNDFGYWWLRSPGIVINSAANVDYIGFGDCSGINVDHGICGVRPALHINLSSSSWSKVGEVRSDEQYNDEPETSPSPESTKKPGETEKPTETPKPTPTPESSAKPSLTPGKQPTLGPTETTKPTGNPADYGISNPRVEDGVTTWDKIKFGSYYQDAEVQPAEPIKWRVLSVDGDDAFLLADEILDCKQYNEENEEVTWETCTLRKWLNNDFYNEAFDDEEKKAVMETVNENNPNYDTEGGNDTKDKVYLLSIAEAGNAAYGFDTEFIEGSKTREAKNTDYAKLNNGNNIWSSSNGLGYWWLRSPGYDSDLATYVCNDGDGNTYGGLVNYITIGVRPALHINLSSSKIEDAGEVNSEGNVTMLGNGISNPVVKDGVTTWDCVYFGNYRQDFSVKQDIEWRVLSVDGNDAFLLSDRNLDCKRYNEEREAVTWETCTLRKWLNEDFYNETFDDEEKKAVMETTVVNEDNPPYGTEGGNDTKDKVYLLSIAEAGNASYGFDTEFNEDSKTREAKNTDYAKVNNIWSSSKGFGYWWLRSPIDDGDSAAFVDDNGSYDGYYVDDGDGVRPALHINLSSSSWSKAGEVRSDGQYNDGPETSASPEPTKKPEETEKPTQTPTPTPHPEPSAKPSPTPGNSNDLLLKEDSNLNITPEGKLTGLIQNKNTVFEIRQQFDNEELIFKDVKGNMLDENDILGTGATISIVENGAVKASCQVVLSGDINGDGKVNGKDVSVLARSLVGKETLSEVQEAAAELTADGKINGKDVARLAQSLIGKATISSQ